MDANRFNRKFVFVAGLHRCGTTLIANMLAGHPEISGFHGTGANMDEGQHLQSVYPVGKRIGGDAVGRLGFDPFAYLTEKSPLAAPVQADELFRQWAPYWDLSRPVLIEKSPPNIIRTRYLQACFPNSHFIAITRHPVAASVATKKWCRRNPVPGIMANWAMCYGRFLEDAKELKSHSIVRYEDLVADPNAALGPVTEAIGVAPLNSLAASVRGDLNEKYFAEWRALLKNPVQKAMALAVRPALEPTFARFGYSYEDAA